MGCAGSIDDAEMYHQIPVKKAQLQKKESPNAKAEMAKSNTVLKKIKICTANLGKTQSPFEYFFNFIENEKSQNSSEQDSLNRTFERISSMYKKSKPPATGESDLKFLSLFHNETISRYTPLKNMMVGLKDEQILMNATQFKQKWNQVFSDLIHHLQKGNRELFKHFSKEIEAQLREFDLICYHTLLSYVYQVQGKGNYMSLNLPSDARVGAEHIFMVANSIQPETLLQKIVDNNLPMAYKVFMQSKFKGPIHSRAQKMDRFIIFVQKNGFDIVFLQEVSQRNFEDLKKKLTSHRIVTSSKGSTAILIKEQLSVEFQQREKNLTLNGHNARYVFSETLSKIKNDENQNKSKGFSKKHEKDGFYESLNLIFSKPPPKVAKPNQNEQSKFLKVPDEIKEPSPLSKIEQKNEQNQAWQKQFISQLIDKTVSLMKLKEKKAKRDSQMIREDQNDTQRGTSPKKKKKKQRSPNKMADNDEDLHIGYELIDKTNSILLKQKGKFTEEDIRNFDDKESVYQFIGCLILISAKVRSSDDLKTLKEKLEILQRKFPYHSIILGLHSEQAKKVHKNKIRDLMKIFRDEEAEQNPKFLFTPDLYSAVPGFFGDDKCSIENRKLKKLVDKKGLFTRINKKTSFHLNQHDRNEQYLGVDSFIIANKQIQECSIRSCKGQRVDDIVQLEKDRKYIPNQDHPFSDFFVCAQILIDVHQVLENYYQVPESHREIQ